MDCWKGQEYDLTEPWLVGLPFPAVSDLWTEMFFLIPVGIRILPTPLWGPMFYETLGG